MTEINFQTDIATDRARVLEALNTHDGLTGWWTNDVNREGEVLFFNFPEVPEPFQLRRERADQDRVVWVNVGAFPPHWAGTTITWQLTEAPGSAGTRVAFSHSGFGGGESELPMITETWGQLMTRLKGFAETGEPDPFFTV
ncbi:SRPBCC domain-containing protein [Streptomyces sp. A3M-1-3]|uniref:SRPBCC family protein n=1 Tax=Streptomyces sp. A3M-1-3 TaxID=2962044 RepID=UPI0020B7060C|nr:SRPBCC domain-containing protein [Streptomyces sp. A3M-1-3]MCP3819752.1 SRPBCC domain-containing protein [Streptomyces sp. A3M-1-3]